MDIRVSEDKIHGSMAEINIKIASGVSADEIKQKVDDILALYTINYTLAIG